jgi:FMN phosphatase YigB (HAD superfamily)
MNTIIFDLDGTLLPMDVQHFMTSYQEALEKYFKPLGPHPNLFMDVMASVKHVIETKNNQNNETKFFEHFFDQSSASKDLYIEHFNNFYESDFSHAQKSTDISKEMIKAISILKEKKYKLIIATNPIFPMVANLKRIAWAGLNPDDFDYISSFEKNKNCKPHLDFYLEVLEANDLDPKDVLMVGNDAQEDLIVQELGIKTYLITNHLINRQETLPYSDYVGSYNDFLSYVEELKVVK